MGIISAHIRLLYDEYIVVAIKSIEKKSDYASTNTQMGMPLDKTLDSWDWDRIPKPNNSKPKGKRCFDYHKARS